jgi:hypothetical protein
LLIRDVHGKVVVFSTGGPSRSRAFASAVCLGRVGMLE